MKFLFFLVFLIGISIFVVTTFYNVQQTFNNFQDIFLQFAIILVAFTMFIVLFRYVAFIFFAIMKTTQKTIDFKIPNKFYNPLVTVVVPAYNEEVTIADSIKSLVRQTYHNLEVIIVDDGSHDNTYKIAHKFHGVFKHTGKEVKVVRKLNGGKSRALNYGIERARGELIMCMDADSKLEKDAVALLVRYFKDPQISAVAGSVFISNQINTVTKLQALEYIEGLNMVRNAQAFLKLVNIIPGPIGMFRKEVLEEVGGYAHDTYAEDCDLTLKLIDKGHKIDFEPDAVAYTEAPDELLNLIKQRYRWTRGILQAIQKHSHNLWTLKNTEFTIVLWYMLFEAIFWPFMDLFASTVMIYISLSMGLNTLLIYWFVLFTMLDISGALFCILVTNEKKSLAFYTILYRFYFIAVVNMAKIFATIEEWFHIEMSWGKLERKGL